MSETETGWLSGPGVPQGELGMRPQMALVIVRFRPEQQPCYGQTHHLSFDDPPNGLTAERYEQYVKQLARDSENVEQFTMMLLRAIGAELVYQHGVEPDVAEREVTEWAKTIYAGEHP